ncbi:hypothetical protein M758_10G142800 [Ceratodon purpureus]|nr:hypothetical protein M758_10G142800 [Ceratodon purpureus]
MLSIIQELQSEMRASQELSLPKATTYKPQSRELSPAKRRITRSPSLDRLLVQTSPNIITPHSFLQSNQKRILSWCSLFENANANPKNCLSNGQSSERHDNRTCDCVRRKNACR